MYFKAFIMEGYASSIHFDFYGWLCAQRASIWQVGKLELANHPTNPSSPILLLTSPNPLFLLSLFLTNCHNIWQGLAVFK